MTENTPAREGKVATVRCIARTVTCGLARGDTVIDLDRPLTVPVGQGTMGRMLDVLEEPVDQGAALPEMDRWPIHRPPLPLARRVTSTDVFETGIKAIDLLAPLERDGKIEEARGGPSCGGVAGYCQNPTNMYTLYTLCTCADAGVGKGSCEPRNCER